MTLSSLLLVALAYVVVTALALAIAAWELLRLPGDYFVAPDAPPAPPGRQWIRIARNVAGAVLVALGVVLSVPGVPGQGVLTILAGLLLIDVPGKRRLERRLIARPAIWSRVNAIRRRFGKEPFAPPRAARGGDGHGGAGVK